MGSGACLGDRTPGGQADMSHGKGRLADRTQAAYFRQRARMDGSGCLHGNAQFSIATHEG
eukprot:5261223-Prymnesium_polylepis.1